ncbi:MAG: carboxypeptidase regulatory-like domain-containing protein, partial [Vicinamibacterales bacterium]|nr:carboxypeptidase regulatory-like domain-containing protein [Vicinamibacterales bacterium]
QPGPDGRLGTSDDILTLGPGETGNAEFLVEGRREGSHVIEMELAGVLNGLPVGPVPIRGRAAGAVLVRNPRFTLTFTHPEIVTAGERYALDVTVTNTGESPANFVSVNLFGRNISGATLVGPPSQSIESIPPGDAQTVSFELVSNLTGRVTAATLDSDENVAGRFALKTAVGELGIPLSPDSLVLPKEAGGLPKPLRDAALGLLGRAYAVATAPAAALPRDVTRFSRKVVYDRAVEVAEAGFRATLGEPLPTSAWHLLLDFAGNSYARLPERNTARELPFIESDYRGFDDLRRRSVRGDLVAARAADLLADPLAQMGAAGFHGALASAASFRAPHVSVLLSSTAGAPLPVTLVLRDAAGRRTGLAGPDGKVVKDVPFSDLLAFGNSPADLTAQLGLLASPSGDYVIELHRNPAAAPGGRFALSLVIPRQDGTFRQVVFGDVATGQVPVVAPAAGDAHLIGVELFNSGAPASGTPAAPPSLSAVEDPAPSVVGVQQQADADVLTCDDTVIARPGRVVAVLLSEEVTPAEAQDKLGAGEISKYEVDGNRVVGVALQPGRRIVFLALRDPIGPFVPRSLTVSGLADRRGQPMPAPDTRPIAITVPETAGVVSGQVLNATGQPASFANVRLFYQAVCGDELVTFGISSKPADEQGRYSFDYVWRPNISNVKLVALDPDTEQFREVRFTLARDAQRLTVDVVFLGRGAIEGRTLDASGRPLAGTVVRVTSLTDQSRFGATTDSEGRYRFDRVPVGNVLVEAVSVKPPAQVFISENVPSPGAVVVRDITLFDVNTAPLQPKVGTIAGFVLRNDGVSPVADVPVYAYYRNRSQEGVRCPPPPGAIEEPLECAIAVTRTDAAGAFAFDRITAGELRLLAFDQAGLEQGDASLQLAPEATATLNVLLVGGLATVTGVVLDPSGGPVAGARVGGGLSIVTAGGDGRFTLVDVPVGRRAIVAVSDALGTRGQAEIDVLRAGETYNATVVLSAVGAVAGVVRESNGTTP